MDLGWGDGAGALKLGDSREHRGANGGGVIGIDANGGREGAS